jgi:gluconolactonase
MPPQASVNVEIIAEGLQFPEGPVAMADGSVLVVEIARGTLSRVCNGRIEIIAHLGGGPNGAALGPDGAMYICNNGGRFQFLEHDGMRFPGPRPQTHQGGLIQRVELRTGKFESLYEACDGRRLNAPNDLVFDKEGGFWFTDHGTGNGDGGLFYAKPDGSSITCWKDNQMTPNGVGLSPDEKTVYFADTHPRKVWAFDLKLPGILAELPRRRNGLLVELPEGNLLDSLAVEAGGRVCVGTLMNGGITACDPDGSFEHYAFPDAMTTNICFGGPQMIDAYLTLSSTGRLGKARWPRPGLKLNFQH